MALDWSPLWLSLRCAALATSLAAVPGLVLAYVLARRPFRGSQLLDAFASLPLMLPPAVLVYYLLAALGRWGLAFNWRVAVVLSAIYTLPLVMRMGCAAFDAVDRGFDHAARSLGAGEWRIFLRITFPLAWPALFAAILAGFARALGDFGLTAIAAAGTQDLSLLLLIAAVTIAALYIANRLRRGRVWV